jgi:hypothetical protein
MFTIFFLCKSNVFLGIFITFAQKIVKDEHRQRHIKRAEPEGEAPVGPAAEVVGTS